MQMGKDIVVYGYKPPTLRKRRKLTEKQMIKRRIDDMLSDISGMSQTIEIMLKKI